MQQIIVDFGTWRLGGMELPLRIYGYGLMLVCGFIFSILLAQWRARRMGENPVEISNCGILALIGGVVGARLAYVVKEWDSFSVAAGSGWREIFNVTSGGLVYFGGLVLGAVFVVVYIRLKRLPVRRFLDIIAPAIMLGLAFGRAGCLLNGCCWGGPVRADRAFAMKFPMMSRPLFKLGGGGPFAEGQTMTPAYARQYWQGSVSPDSRLTNAYATMQQTGPDGKTVTSAALIPIPQLHGQLTCDQLTTMFADRADARKAFDEIADSDGYLTCDQWREALANPAAGGFLRGSEIWAEAVRYDAVAGPEGLSQADGRLSFEEAWAYLHARKVGLLKRFDADGDGKLTGREYTAANAYLQADLFAILAAQRSGALRPAQPLGIINALVMMLLLLAFSRHRRREGQVFALMLVLYPVTRFVLESIRHDDPLNVIYGNWTHNQISALAMVALGVVLWFWFARLPASAGPIAAEKH